ncbi:MAG: hypothetical protein QOJ34_692 [Pseudonocardiales bacterium]|nr:hypothetical protein [Pseudonocardiales bacterium]
MTMPMERLAPWLGAGGISDAGDGRLTVQGAGAEPVPVEVRTTGSGAELCATWSAPAGAVDLDLAPLARATALARPGALRCEAQPGRVLIAAPLFLDGLTQQQFVSTAHDVAKAYETFAAAHPGPAAEPEPPAEPAPAAPERSEPSGQLPSLVKHAAPDESEPPRPASTAPISEALTVAVPDPEPPASATPAPAVPAPATPPPAAQWRRSHVLPPEGQQAWAAPDFGAQSVQAPGGYEVQIVEVRGEWAHVAGRDGWTGWLEARRLIPVPPA